MSDTPFYRLPLVPRYHSGGTVTGRFPKPPEERPLERLARRDHMTHVTVSVASMDFSEIEKRVMAQLAHKTGIQHALMGGRELTGIEAEVVLEAYRRAFGGVLDKWLRTTVEAMWSDLQAQIDEEGCGPLFAALKNWED